MISREHIVIGSRGSKLALVQSRFVLAELSKIHPDQRFELLEISTAGDRNWEIPLEGLGGAGVFVKELEDALLRGEIDLAVHSLKDMLTTLPEGLRLAAVPERVDPRDVLVSRSGMLAEIPAGAKIGTGSQRRAIQIRAQRPDIEICGLRGNIETRIKRVSPEGLDGIIMAAAALIRLGMEDRITEYLPPETFVPAVGQGALGVEIRADDTHTAEIVAPLNHEPTRQAVTAERQFLKAMGGGCRAPIAASGTIADGSLSLSGMVASPDGSEILSAEVAGVLSAPEEAGDRLAQEMIGLGANDLLAGKKRCWSEKYGSEGYNRQRD
ncbi:MAG: hydroxymethylbilane synthase [Chloroflexi bacterium CG07_land_8_20_14_0_80_51_10]|nr:MAG: hydroxymethylbilane synthase [Chloroflexi bacterium CG07_land_8_20_14_0_80_51_10]